MELRNDDMPVLKRPSDHGNGLLVQYDRNGAGGGRFKPLLRLGSSRHPFVDATGYLAINQKRIAAMSKVPARPNEHDKAAGSLVLITKRPQAQMNIGTRSWERGAVDMGSDIRRL